VTIAAAVAQLKFSVAALGINTLFTVAPTKNHKLI
jgi:hypothetical protein